MPAKWFIRKTAERLAGQKIPDLNSGLRAFRKDVAEPYLKLLPPGFSCVTTITLAFLSNQHDIRYVPIDYFKRAGSSKFHFVHDAYRYILQVLRMVMYFNPLKVLMPPALWLIGLGIAKGVFDMVVHPVLLREQHGHDLRDRADHRLDGAARRPDRALAGRHVRIADRRAGLPVQGRRRPPHDRARPPAGRAGHEVTLESWKAQYPSFLYPGEQTISTPEGVPFPGTRRALAWYRPDGWVRAGRRLRSYDLVVLVVLSPVQVPAYLGMALLRPGPQGQRATARRALPQRPAARAQALRRAADAAAAPARRRRPRALGPAGAARP